MRKVTRFLILLALLGVGLVPGAVAVWEPGKFDDPAWFDDGIVDNDWFYDSYDTPIYDPGLDEYHYGGAWDDRWDDSDWYYDRYVLGRWDPWWYDDDPGEVGWGDM